MRSRMASANVGSPNHSCRAANGSWLLLVACCPRERAVGVERYADAPLRKTPAGRAKRSASTGRTAAAAGQGYWAIGSGRRGQALQRLAEFSHDRIVCGCDAGRITRPLLMLVERGHALIDRLERSDGRFGHAQSRAQGAQERARHTCRSIQGTSCCSQKDQLERNTQPAVRPKPFSNGRYVGSADSKRLLHVEVR